MPRFTPLTFLLLAIGAGRIAAQDGPWLTNARGVGALAFHAPVEP